MSDVTTELVRKHYAKGPTAYFEDGIVAKMPTPEDVAYCEAQFDRWLAQHDREVARRAIFAAADEFMNGHQADKPHDNFRTGVPSWLNRYAAAHYGESQSADVSHSGGE